MSIEARLKKLEAAMPQPPAARSSEPFLRALCKIYGPEDPAENQAELDQMAANGWQFSEEEWDAVLVQVYGEGAGL